jgi:hypothetical protein
MKAFILIFLFSLSTCVNTSYKAVPPEKVKSIPDKAFWVGGVDGGNWYLLDFINKSRKEAFFKIYNDYTGELIESKKFKLKCDNDDGINWNDLKGQINAFDGERILLEIKGKEGTSKYCDFE